MPREPGMVTYTELKARGWTDALIASFMPGPDREFRNRHSGGDRKSVTRMYSAERVERIEAAATLLANRIAKAQARD